MSSGASGRSQRAGFASVSTTDTAESLDGDEDSNSPSERGSSVDPTYVDHRDHGDGPEDTPRPETPPLFDYPPGTTQHTPARSKLLGEGRDLSETLRKNIYQAAGGSDCFATREPFTNSNHVGMHFIPFATKGLVLVKHEAFAGSTINTDGRWNIAMAEGRLHTNADAGRWGIFPVVSRENPVLLPELWTLRQNCEAAPGERTPYTDILPQKVFPDSWCFKLVNLNYNGPVPLVIYTRQPDGSFLAESYPDSATADIFGTTHINPMNMVCHAGEQVHKYPQDTDIPTFARLSPVDRTLITQTRGLTDLLFSKTWVPQLSPATISSGLSTPVRAPRTRSKANMLLKNSQSDALIPVNEDNDDVQSEPEFQDDSPARRAKKKLLERKRASSMSRASTPPVSPPPGPRRSSRIAPRAAEKQAKATATKKGKGKAVVDPKTTVKPKTAGKAKAQARPTPDAPETSKKNKRTEDEDEDDVEKDVTRPKKRGRAGN
ncbi:hypothetical protein CYLTODRAFT_425636 [Cylindrobasidium torrendii FP15055 ss-10]|uniref:Uncharacterized protein n=1 Tax=Cylindrobasidium torrendii FP15055 ss-10 TaxID=1314674 RepID=A0A0D7B0I7_9AGAR|nr:hypothetical protein CYLTODRAFT_425636 [Cylindrobasidium torrendii FP15055 ss-10]